MLELFAFIGLLFFLAICYFYMYATLVLVLEILCKMT
jgi:hypothetical protein